MAQDGRTLALVLGASEFPSSPTLGGGEAFENSAQDFRAYLYDPKGLSLPPADVLDLFDDGRPAGELLERIMEFLNKRQKRSTSTDIARLLMYYVGHGGFTPSGQEYFLAVRSTRYGSEGFTSIRITDLAQIIKDNARFLCQYLILDCCFSAQAYATFQTGPADAAVAKTLDKFPTKGTALLCSSGPREVSLAPQGCAHTMFSEALLDVLKKGDSNRSEFLSLYEVRDLIDWQLRARYQDELVRPQVQCPNQPEGDLSHLPLFPNPAYKSSTELRRVIVPEDSALQLPNEISAALRNSLPGVRLAAVNELLELFKCTSSRTLAGLARTEIQERSEKDDSTQVRTNAKDALLECDAFGPASVRSEYIVAIDRHPTNPVQVETASENPALAGVTDLESLNLFLETARKLNSTNFLEEVLQTLLEASLRLTKAERGFVFLVDPSNEMRRVAGRDKNGEVIHDDSTISKSVLREAAASVSEFVVTDTEESEKLLNRKSVVAENLRCVICIPLRRTSIRGKTGDEAKASGSELQGVLYLDSHFLPGKLSSVSQDILRSLANGAAMLVENAALQEAEESAKRYHLEMSLAGKLQQRLMAVPVPDVPYAKVKAVSYACKDIGGDFFDLVYTEHSLSLVVADVSGKGVSAAVVASTLQGMLYSHLALDSSLPEMLQAVNKYMCEKIGGQKYLTLLVARLHSNGELELANCGGVPPLVVSGQSVRRIEDGNLPIGLIPTVNFTTLRFQLERGDRLLLVTDGVTEAENPEGEFFGNDRLENRCRDGFDAIEAGVMQFRGNTPLSDDCTLTELIYSGGQ